MLWKSRDVPKIATGGIGVNVHVAGWVPGQTVPVVPTVVEPGAVVRKRNPIRGIAVRINFSEKEFNLDVGPWRTVGSGQG